MQEQEMPATSRPLPGPAGFLVAARQLTGWDDESPVGTSAVYYPAVGLLLGALMLCFDRLLLGRMTVVFASLAVLAVQVVLTRGRPLRGLARSLVRAVYPRAAASVVVLGISSAVLFGLGVWLLAAIDQGRSVALLFAPMLGRCSMVVIATGSREAREDGRQMKFSRELTFREFGIASTVVFAVVFLTTNFLGLLLVLGTGFLTIALRLLAHWSFGGVDRDSLHAAGEIVQLAVFGMIALF